MPTDGESLLLHSLKDLDCRDSEASTNDTISEQSNGVHTLIDEVNEEYSFWRPHQNEEYPVDPIPVSYKIDTSKYHSSTEAVPKTTPALVNRTDIVSNEDASSNLTVVTATAAANDDDDNNSNLKLKLDGENLIGHINGIQQEYLTEYEASSHGNNYYDNKYGVFCDRSDDDNPPPLPPESLGDDVWKLERNRSNDDNYDFNYDAIDQEILQFKHEDSTGGSETIVFHDCYEDVCANQ